MVILKEHSGGMVEGSVAGHARILVAGASRRQVPVVTGGGHRRVRHGGSVVYTGGR